MRLLLILLIALTMCSLSLAMPMAQNVGGDYGKSWLTKNSDKFDSSSGNDAKNTNDLWTWGGKPQGYEVFNGKLYSLLAPTDWYYPAFTSNTTPIVVNGTALIKNRNSLPLDYLFPDFTSDPWSLAQQTERPVMVIYPDESRNPLLIQKTHSSINP